MEKEQANFRLDAAAKEQAYAILSQIGVKPTDAVNMLMHHIALYGELPFKPSIPNAETAQTLRESDKGENLNHYKDVDELFEKLDL